MSSSRRCFAANTLEQYEVEWSGLETLSHKAGILTPHGIALHSVEDVGTLMLLEGLPEIKNNAPTAYWYQAEPHKPFDLPDVEKRLPLEDKG